MAAAWSRVNTFILLIVLFGLLALIGLVANRAWGGPLDPPGAGTPASTDSVRLPGTPISGQFTITTPGHYYLTRDVRVTGSNTGITINASEVSLDLGGFTIDGSDTIATIGILIAGAREDISIRNGEIRDFSTAVDAGNDSRVVIDHVRAASNFRGFNLGIANVLSNCVSSGNTDMGISVSTLGGSSTISDCVVTLNSSHGIRIDGSLSVVENSVLQANNGTDVYIALGNNVTVRDNTVDTIRIEVDRVSTYVADNVCVQGSLTNASGNATNFAPTGGTHPHDNPGC